MFTALALGAILANAATSTEVTVYNQGFGLIKEVRTLHLKQGKQTVSVEDVASMVDPSSVGIKNLSKNAFSVLEQNYQYDLINTQAILNKSVGQKIRFIRTVGGKREVLEGTLLSAPTAIVANPQGYSEQTYNGLVIKTDDGRIVLNPTGEIEVSSVPAGLISKPTLLWDIDSEGTADNNIELSYISQGMSWNSDYVLTIDGVNQADLKGWVTINNQSGATFENAKLKLLAGDVNQAPQAMFKGARGGFGGGTGGPGGGFVEQSLFEYHLYTLDRPATVRNKETKQISLLEGHGVPYSKKLIVDATMNMGQYYPSEGEVGTGPIKPQVRIEFKNDEKSGLGMPLPKGKVRIYQRDNSGSVQLLGEDNINHTPKNEQLSLIVGRSFDVVASRKRTNFTVLGPNHWRESFEVEVRNRKTTSETVSVYERHWGDWKVTEKSMNFTKLDAQTMDFEITLKPDEVRTIAYTVETRW